jgi:hypothetical protein
MNDTVWPSSQIQFLPIFQNGKYAVTWRDAAGGLGAVEQSTEFFPTLEGAIAEAERLTCERVPLTEQVKAHLK